jgi:hypothetical protein
MLLPHDEEVRINEHVSRLRAGHRTAQNSAMRFLIFVIDDNTALAGPNEMAHIDAFNEMLEANGHWITAGGIHHGAQATVLDNRNDAGLITDGSLYNEVEHYSGFWLINAADRDEALALAAAGSKACNRKVELRPYLR